jgi:hypothetical protein
MSSGKHPGGERHVSERIQKALAPNERGMICLSCCGTRPSLGPEARAHKSALNLLGDTPRGCRVRNSIAVGQTRENGRNRHRGWSESGDARLATQHRSRKGEGVSRKKRKMVEAIVPARQRESMVWLPACRKNAVAEVGRRRLVPNTLGKRALKKSGQGRVNGGLARSERRRVKPSMNASSEENVDRSGTPDKNGSESAETHGDVRASSSGFRG